MEGRRWRVEDGLKDRMRLIYSSIFISCLLLHTPACSANTARRPDWYAAQAGGLPVAFR